LYSYTFFQFRQYVFLIILYISHIFVDVARVILTFLLFLPFLLLLYFFACCIIFMIAV